MERANISPGSQARCLAGSVARRGIFPPTFFRSLEIWDVALLGLFTSCLTSTSAGTRDTISFLRGTIFVSTVFWKSKPLSKARNRHTFRSTWVDSFLTLDLRAKLPNDGSQTFPINTASVKVQLFSNSWDNFTTKDHWLCNRNTSYSLTQNFLFGDIKHN